MSFLRLEDKTFLISGVANKKSVAYFCAQTLLEEKAKIILGVQNGEILSKVEKLFPSCDILICDALDSKSIEAMGENLRQKNIRLDGFLHSIAFAPYDPQKQMQSFHQTSAEDFNLALRGSCFSLVEMSKVLEGILKPQSSVVSVSISNTKATSYGYMGPIKAALESSVAFLAKSFSQSESSRDTRFNAVCSGPLKTSASAGIPGYVDNYLYAQMLTLRKSALTTQEVADTICFLLSPRSSGINASGVMVDLGMSANYFDQDVIKATLRGCDGRP